VKSDEKYSRFTGHTLILTTEVHAARVNEQCLNVASVHGRLVALYTQQTYVGVGLGR